MKHCLDCGNPKSRKGIYCKKCGYKHRKRPTGLSYKIKVVNKGWFTKKDRTVLDNKGYVRRRVCGKMQRVHKVILEDKLGRRLKNDEVTHHLNGIKTDNRSENLVVMLKVEHDKLHNGKGIIRCDI